jgi:hypothetical protein
VAGRDRGLQHVVAIRTAESLRAIQGRQPALDQEPIPARPILIEQQDRATIGRGARRGARGLQLHQRDQTVDFGIARRESDQHAAQAQRLLAQGRAHPVRAGRRGIAFVEDQIDHTQDGVEALVALRRIR